MQDNKWYLCFTENNEIIKEAEKNKAKIILRPKKLSTSTAHEIDAWKHAIIYLKKKLLTQIVT